MEGLKILYRSILMYGTEICFTYVLILWCLSIVHIGNIFTMELQLEIKQNSENSVKVVTGNLARKC